MSERGRRVVGVLLLLAVAARRFLVGAARRVYDGRVEALAELLHQLFGQRVARDVVPVTPVGNDHVLVACKIIFDK